MVCRSIALYNFVSSSSVHIVPCSFVSGNLLQLKLFNGFPGVGTFFFGLGAAGARGARGASGAGGGAGAGGARGIGGGMTGGGGGGGTLHVSMTALLRLLT